MNKPALARAFAAALLLAFTTISWTLWPTPAPAPRQAIPTAVDQFPGIVPLECRPGAVDPAREEMSE